MSGLNAVNVLAAVNSQAPLPSDFYLSLTGSTGGSTNIHELDDLQVCATDINPIGQQIDHFEFIYTASALTCNPQPVTIRACLNSSCSSLYTNPVSVTLSPASYWTATAPATVSGSTITFSGARRWRNCACQPRVAWRWLRNPRCPQPSPTARPSARLRVARSTTPTAACCYRYPTCWRPSRHRRPSARCASQTMPCSACRPSPTWTGWCSSLPLMPTRQPAASRWCSMAAMLAQWQATST